MSYKVKEAERELKEAEKKLKKAKRDARIARIGPMTLQRAKEMRERIRALQKRANSLWGTLFRRCPHSWKVVKRYDEPDCDGLFGGWVHYRECLICTKYESLPIDNLRKR